MCSSASCERLPEEERAAAGDHAAGKAQHFLSPSPAMNRADADPHCVQASGRDDEAQAVEQRALAGRQFGAVRVSVEDGEEADQPAATPSGGRTSNNTAAPKQNRRQRDAVLSTGQRHAHQAEHSPERHHHGEGHGQQPDRRCAKLRAPQPDRDHRQHMIQPGDRMTKAGQESDGFALLRMCEGTATTAQPPSARPASAQQLLRSGLCPRACPELVEGFASFVWRNLGRHHRTPHSRDTRWMVQNAPSEPTVYPGKRLHPAWPADFQNAEGALERQDQRDETQLAELDSDVEAHQRQRQFMPRQAGAGQRAGEIQSRAAAQTQKPPPRDDEW